MIKIISIFLAGVMILEGTGYGVEVSKEKLRVFLSQSLERLEESYGAIKSDNQGGEYGNFIKEHHAINFIGTSNEELSGFSERFCRWAKGVPKRKLISIVPADINTVDELIEQVQKSTGYYKNLSEIQGIEERLEAFFRGLVDFYCDYEGIILVIEDAGKLHRVNFLILRVLRKIWADLGSVFSIVSLLDEKDEDDLLWIDMPLFGISPPIESQSVKERRLAEIKHKPKRFMTAKEHKEDVRSNIPISYTRSQEEEEKDVKDIKFLLQNSDIINDELIDIFSLHDITKDEIALSSINIEYLREGGFKRVYKVTMPTHSGDRQFVFICKMIKRNINVTDTGYNYDAEFMDWVSSLAKCIHRHSEDLHPHVGKYYYFNESLNGPVRIFTEGFVDQTQDVLTPEYMDRLIIAGYIKCWVIFNGKVFFKDPARRNVVIFKRDGEYRVSIIDLDQAFRGEIEVDDMLNSIKSWGFSYNDLVRAVIDVFGERIGERLIEFYLGNGGFTSNMAPAYRQYLKERYEEPVLRGLESVVRLDQV